jgi:hypothetical protein
MHRTTQKFIDAIARRTADPTWKRNQRVATMASWLNDERRQKFADAVREGNHKRFHVARGIVSDTCKFCVPEDEEQQAIFWPALFACHRYPIFIISKGRWKSPLTVRALEKMPDVHYYIVVEPKEADAYAKHLPDPSKMVVAPEDFSERGQGSIPVRNYVWDLAIKWKTGRHWLMDDNIHAFFRLNKNMHHKVRTGVVFAATEDFVDRYENVPIAGFSNTGLCKRGDKLPAFVLNSRVYSCTLIQNHIPELNGERWRGRYNEDTDLCLRVLKAGLCTFQMVAFTADKSVTMKMKGGNTDELYAGDPKKIGSGRWQMAESLRLQHPDVVKVGWRFNRWQHVVDYRPFKKNKLQRSHNWRDFVRADPEYGMRLVSVSR